MCHRFASGIPRCGLVFVVCVLQHFLDSEKPRGPERPEYLRRFVVRFRRVVVQVGDVVVYFKEGHMQYLRDYPSPHPPPWDIIEMPW